MERNVMEQLIKEHNAVVNALVDADIQTATPLKIMAVFHKLACEGATIVHEAREMGINCKINMQSGLIVF